jgi:hypothetical protein
LRLQILVNQGDPFLLKLFCEVILVKKYQAVYEILLFGYFYPEHSFEGCCLIRNRLDSGNIYLLEANRASLKADDKSLLTLRKGDGIKSCGLLLELIVTFKSDTLAN